MHGHTLRRGTGIKVDVPEAPCPRTGAVTWIDAKRALVARSSADGTTVVNEVRRSARRRDPLGPFLARVVDEIGDRDRVVILGPDAMRVELEREYVAINRRPDRLVDVEAAPEADEAALRARLATITAG